MSIRNYIQISWNSLEVSTVSLPKQNQDEVSIQIFRQKSLLLKQTTNICLASTMSKILTTQIIGMPDNCPAFYASRPN